MIAAGIFYKSGDEVLLMKRRDDCDNGGTWAFPGGKIEAGETAEVAAAREFFEETGTEIATNMSLATKNDKFSLFKTEGEKFNPILNDEHTAFQWVKADTLPEPLHPGVREQFDACAEDAAQRADLNGFISIDRNPISRSGIFQYLGRSLGAEEPDRIYNVYRPGEELADPECIESFKLIPIVDDHTMIGEGYGTSAERKGVHGSTGEDVFFEDRVLYSNLRFFSDTMKSKIQGGKKHLSLGYRCVYEKASGVYDGQEFQYIQRKLRGNHLALVDQSRCDVVVLDSGIAMDYADVTISPPKQEQDMADKTETPTGEDAKIAKIIADALAPINARFDALDSAFEEMKKEKAEGDEAEEKKKEGEDEEEEEEEKAEDKKASATDAAEIRKLRNEVKELKDGGYKAIVTEVSARNALADKLSHHIGTFDHADKTLAEVAKYGCEKLGIACDSGHEHTALNGYLHNRPNPSAVKTTGMDGGVREAKGSEVSAYLAKKN